ncbi:hypothetical protein EHS25_004647 [Saitozyma podzolica]|uniref:HlyIII-domain-containing protein n=1 Tax=Saitozyma podzolica TaxID=1890683 RepID=A0A427YV07_9TREE|nr:hypothetical protein EHS25_004647 [Saitozyma podzolica]
MSTSTTSRTPLLPKSQTPPEPRLTDYHESLRTVPWQTDNEYILSGYRRQLHSIRACLWSAIAYLHNESVNIHSHSLGALFFLVLIPLHLTQTHFPTWSLFHWFPRTTYTHDPTPIPPTLYDKVALTVYLVAAVGCLGLSSWFHTVQCHSRAVCDAAHRGDYIGIVVLIVGSILPGMYYTFHGRLYLQIFYMGAILAAGITSAYIVLSPHHRSHRWHRTLTFIGLGLSAVVPITHVIISQGIQHARETTSLDLVIASGASYIVGAVMYAARFPEHLAPGRFDIWFSSHNIFHLFVLAGAWLQYAALRGMVWGRAMAVGGGGGLGA